MNTETTTIRIPAEFPVCGVVTECDGHRPFLLLGDSSRTVVACQRLPGNHIGMYADCDCCDCTSHRGPGWTSLRWNRHTPGALESIEFGREAS